MLISGDRNRYLELVSNLRRLATAEQSQRNSAVTDIAKVYWQEDDTSGWEDYDYWSYYAEDAWDWTDDPDPPLDDLSPDPTEVNVDLGKASCKGSWQVMGDDVKSQEQTT